jgi:hypothetical protein
MGEEEAMAVVAAAVVDKKRKGSSSSSAKGGGSNYSRIRMTHEDPIAELRMHGGYGGWSGMEEECHEAGSSSSSGSSSGSSGKKRRKRLKSYCDTKNDNDDENPATPTTPLHLTSLDGAGVGDDDDDDSCSRMSTDSLMSMASTSVIAIAEPEEEASSTENDPQTKRARSDRRYDETRRKNAAIISPTPIRANPGCPASALVSIKAWPVENDLWIGFAKTSGERMSRVAWGRVFPGCEIVKPPPASIQRQIEQQCRSRLIADRGAPPPPVPLFSSSSSQSPSDREQRLESALDSMIKSVRGGRNASIPHRQREVKKHREYVALIEGVAVATSSTRKPAA